ncbi:mCG59404 [Mus musculus]|nr:mCG59404 [Mus musculus]
MFTGLIHLGDHVQLLPGEERALSTVHQVNYAFTMVPKSQDATEPYLLGIGNAF